jgi:hypothetical protein
LRTNYHHAATVVESAIRSGIKQEHARYRCATDSAHDSTTDGIEDIQPPAIISAME